MYKYSPITKLYIKNFRNIGEAIIDFEDSPIVSLIGENEAGKTSVVKAFAVCALHSSPRDQKDYIRDGTTGFGVAIELEDGTRVTRMKTSTANRYTVSNKEKVLWDTAKIDSGLPVQVQEVMGLIEEHETKEYLQVRTYEDQLLFVVTPASTNYKVMYDALKVDQLTRAIKLGSKEANSIKAEIDSNDNGIYTLTSSLRNIKVYELEPLVNVKQRLNKELGELSKLAAAYNLLETIKARKAQLGAMSGLFTGDVQEVNEVEASRLESINRVLSNVANIKSCVTRLDSLETAEFVDLTEYNKFSSIQSKKETVKGLKSRIGSVVEISEAESVDEMQLEHLLTAYNLHQHISTKKSALSLLDTTGAEEVAESEQSFLRSASTLIERSNNIKVAKQTLQQYDAYCNQMSEYLKNLGAAFEVCPRCGEEIVIDVEKFA